MLKNEFEEIIDLLEVKKNAICHLLAGNFEKSF